MSKVFLLGRNREIDRSKQVVKVNHEVILEHQINHRYVVYKITESDWGINYHLINMKTFEFTQADIIEPISQKFGIGFYYNDSEEVMIDAFEVQLLVEKGNKKKQEQKETEEKERQRVEEVKEIGRKRFTEIFPQDAQAVIVAKFKQDESDSQTDYFASSTTRTVILGFSTHKRDIFSEMRKYASNFEDTAYLSEYNADYEHREKYSMGAGYYLGESKYHGWIVEKCPVYKRENTIEEFAYTAGNTNNIHIKKTDKTPPPPPSNENTTDKSNCTLVEYSTKALAVFGDTKPIKDELKAMGGRFNNRLTFNGKKLAGWIFPISMERNLAYYFGLN